MSLVVKNTRDLLDPENFKMKTLLFGIPGSGKTEWAAGMPDPAFAACETGHGKGLLTIATKGLPYVEPMTYEEFEQIAAGKCFADRESLAVDSASDMVKTFIKDYALTIPRSKGESAKRQKGVPELDDYGVMGELTRRLLRKLLGIDKHITVTATLRIDKPDPENGQGQMLIGPDLPGQMFLGATAMFDLVLCLRTRPALKVAGDAKSRYNQRFLMTDGDGTYITKSRTTVDGKPLLPKEVVYNLETGEGSWKDLYTRVVEGYKKSLALRQAQVVVPSTISAVAAG